MSKAIAIVALLIAFSSEAQQMLGSRLVTIESTNITEKAWTRSVVMVGEDGEFIGDEGKISAKAATDAIDYAATNAVKVSQTATAQMTESMDYLYSKTNQMASSCVQVAMHIAPETVRSNLTGYVVKTETVGDIDHQWVWYNKQMALKPIRFVAYDDFGTKTSVKCNWVNWTTNGVTVVTAGGQTWNGCHECTVERPAFARGKTCLDLPNEVWGGEHGIDWGDMLLTCHGVPYYTGFVTNGISGAVLYFDNGFLKPNPQ